MTKPFNLVEVVALPVEFGLNGFKLQIVLIPVDLVLKSPKLVLV